MSCLRNNDKKPAHIQTDATTVGLTTRNIVGGYFQLCLVESVDGEPTDLEN